MAPAFVLRVAPVPTPKRASATCAARRVVVSSQRGLGPKDLGYEPRREHSAWRDNVFCGGFPGGEVFLNKWIEEGMKGDVPELQPDFQPSHGVQENKNEEMFCHPLLGYCWETSWQLDDEFGDPAMA